MQQKVQSLFEPSDKKMRRQVRQNVREIEREIKSLNRDISKTEKEQDRLKMKMKKDAGAGRHVRKLFLPLSRNPIQFLCSRT